MTSRFRPPALTDAAEFEGRRLYYRLRRIRYAEMRTEYGPSTAVADQALGRTLAEREQQIAKLTADNAALRDLALRARAELDNARKRFRRERDETIKFANEELVRELVVVVDNLERAVSSSEENEETKPIYDGVRMVLNQFLGILQTKGLEVIASDGQQFDPHFHEAVSAEEREDLDENQIIGTLQKGYMLSGRVVRPAMVRVARAVSRPAPAPVEEVAAESAEEEAVAEASGDEVVEEGPVLEAVVAPEEDTLADLDEPASASPEEVEEESHAAVIEDVPREEGPVEATLDEDLDVLPGEVAEKRPTRKRRPKTPPADDTDLD